MDLHINESAEDCKRKIQIYPIGKKGTRSGEGELEKTTGNRLVLIGVIKALERMKNPAAITIHTDNRYLFANAAYLPTWVLSGWKRKDNKKIQNEDLWRKIWDLQKGHVVCCQEDNTIQAMFEGDM